MLKLVLRYIYFSFIILFIFLLLIKESLTFDFNNIIIVSYFVIFLPLFDYLIDYIKKDALNIKKTDFYIFWKIKDIVTKYSIKIVKNFVFGKIISFIKFILNSIYNYRKIIFWIGLFYWIYVISGDNLFNLLTLAFLVYSIYLKIDSRVSFFIALILLIITPLLLILEKKELAESYSVYAYYFLVIWVVISIYENINLKFGILNKIVLFFNKVKNISVKTFIWVKELFQYIKLNYISIFYDLILISFVAFISSFYYLSAYNALINIALFVFLVYVIFKFLWFSFDFEFEKIRLINRKNINYLTIFLSTYVIVFSAILEKTTIDDKWVYITLISLTAFLLFLSIFTDLMDVIKSIFLKNVYVSLSAVVAFMIIFFNFYSQDIQKAFSPTIENKEETETKTEEVKTPEITKPIEEEKIPEVKPEIIKFDISMFQDNLWVWSTWENVWILQKFLRQYGYYNLDITSNYDENTRIAMMKFLEEKCGWKSTNKWVLWPLVREDCLKWFLEKN